MLTLVFAEPRPGPVVTRGPFPEVRADAICLRAGNGGEVIARHENHCWRIGAREFFRIDCEGPVRVYFEDPGGQHSEVLGPFFHFSSADGLAYGDGEICGRVDVDAGTWFSHREQAHWKEMVVVPAG